VNPDSIDLRLDAMEAELTDTKYSSCLDQTDDLTKKGLDETQSTVMHTLQTACFWGAKKYLEALQSLELLGVNKDSVGKLHWVAGGDRYFFSHAPDFAQGRAEWDALFAALEQHDSQSWIKAVENLAAALRRNKH
jgi:hypothetical protein